MKVIGLSATYIDKEGIAKSGVNETYVKAVLKAGAVPMILPICQDQEAIKKMVECCDAVILTGGVDIHPSYYHEKISRYCGAFDVERDRFEMMLLEVLEAKKMPVLGICRGLQMLNVYYGGSLYQDLNQEKSCTVMHQQVGSRGYGCHAIEVKAQSFLSEIYQNGDLINSYHHQAVKDLATCFKVSALSQDGVIEAFEHIEQDIYAVQFHPEVMVENDEKALMVFKKFMERIGG